jgi:hypothetical protein
VDSGDGDTAIPAELGLSIAGNGRDGSG